MDIDVSKLKFEDASQEDKKRISRLINTRGMIWLIISFVGIAIVFLLAFLLHRATPLALFALGVAAIVLIITAITDMPAKKCKVCYGTVSEKREIHPDAETGLYYNAVTFTPDKGEELEEVPIFSKKTLRLLDEGSRAVIVQYNNRPPVIYADAQVHPAEKKG